MTDAAALAEIIVHEIEELDLRAVFPREDNAFTPWLSQPQNLARLSRSLNIDIELEATEVSTGIFRTDILARNLADGSRVVIENQFGRSDHDHFGKAMTYLAAHEAKIVIWIADSFADEHRAALTWLNDNTPEDVGFYSVAPRLMRIAGSPPGLRFDVVVAPNSFVKKKKQEERKIDEAISGIRARFWTAFSELLTADGNLADCSVRYGGRLGFKWILPPVNAVWSEAEPRLLLYLAVPNNGTPAVGIALRCRDDAKPEAKARTEHAIEQLETRGVMPGHVPADLSSDVGIRSAAADLLVKAKLARNELTQAFS